MVGVLHEKETPLIDNAAYEETEIGLLPKHWKVEPVEDFAVITTGGRNTQDRVDDGAYPFFVRSQQVERINTYSFDGEAVLTAGDGVGTGKIFHYINGKCDIHQRVYRISDFRYDVDGYYFYLFFSANFYNRIMQMTAKSSVDSVRREMIARMLIALPPRPEQKAIAEALSDADALIASLEALIAKKRAIKQGLMQDLLSGRKRLSGFDKKWRESTFGEVFDFFPTATNSRADLSSDGNVHYVHYGDVHTRFHSHLDFTKQSVPKIFRPLCPNAALLKNGDWIMADASEDFEGVGKSVEVSGLSQDQVAVSGLHTFLLREKKETFTPGFKGHLGASEELRRQYLRVMTGMKVYGVSKAALKNLLLPIPERAEQEAITLILNDLDAELAALDVKLRKAAQIKLGMMQNLLTGRIRLL